MNKLSIFAFTLTLVYLLSGCVAFHHRGPKGVTWKEIEETKAIKKGAQMEDVARIFGEPDKVRNEGVIEVWVYHFSRTFYIVVYGEAEWKDLEITFEQSENKQIKKQVKSHRYTNQGESFSIFIPPAAVHGD